MKKIPLRGRHGKGKFALVDDSDYERLNKFKWYLHESRGKYYVIHSSATVNGKQTKVMMHHCIIGKPPKGMDTDHINGNCLDNRRCNLRLCTRSQNMANRKKNKIGTSKFKGVHWCKTGKKFMAKIMYLGNHYYLGYFNDEIEAAEIYDKKALEFQGQYARLNFPENKMLYLLTQEDK